MKTVEYLADFSVRRGTYVTEAEQPDHDEITFQYEQAASLQDELDEIKKWSRIVSIDKLDTEKTKDGILHTYGFVTAAGYAYAAMVGIAKNPKSDLLGLGKAAWLTSINGVNEHTVRKFMQAGNNMIFTGSEGSYHSGKLPIPKRFIILAGSAAATLSFAEQIVPEPEFVKLMHPTDRFVIGGSEGAMTGMGVNVLDEQYGQYIVYSDLTAPCFATRINFRESPKLIKQLYHEGKSAVQLAGKLTISGVIHYPSTLDPNFYNMLNQALIVPALVSGEAGEMAKLIPYDKIGHVTCFNNDAASQQPIWVNRFANHPDWKVTPLDGSHLYIEDPQTSAFLLMRNGILIDAYNSKGRNIKGDDIFIPASIYGKEILAQAAS